MTMTNAPATAAPVAEIPVQKPAQPYVVNCHQCGAALRVTDANVVYMCPVCKALMRVRIGEKLVMDVSRPIVAESYVNVVKDYDLN